MSPVRTRRKLRKIVREFKTNRRCTDCKQKFHYSRMSYDHVRGEKKFTFGESLLGVTEEDLWEEIKKCKIRCLDCHRERELERRASA